MTAHSEAFDGQVDVSAPPSGMGCVECTAAGSWWVHLRRCAACGHVGCCNDSLNRHATAHAVETGHRFIQSFEPGEEWFWDYTSEVFLADGPALSPPTSHPSYQPAPGPEGRVPADWLERLDERNRREARR
jgi:hypothetical protein